ncbi:MAG TPA: type 2 isopentenyl-diphosphate Delta-isomerase [Candidatus Kapabacteria bacterium]|nr:type 2 isopentenyl-diphosphate Delta-isomerase [Candidatus Kapabacteria bacterium]
MGKKKKAKKITARETTSRKAEHVALVVEGGVSHHSTAGFASLRFEHNALPELALANIDTSTFFFGKHLGAPLLISSMTGGYDEAERINRSLARAARKFGLAIGIGSARQALENKKYHRSFSVVRKEHPDGLVFSNIGGAEVASLGRRGDIGSLKKIIDLVEADALVIHLNPLQELMQPEGSRDFRGILAGIETACNELGVPIIVKEVGAGISRSVAERLLNAGVRAIDVAGSGGTSWAGVEILRQKKDLRSTFEEFWDWGIPTTEAIRSVNELRTRMTFGLIASGGIRSGLDIAKAIALGADLAAMAQPLVKSLADEGEDALMAHIEAILTQLQYAMLLTGSATITALHKQALVSV